MLTNIRQLRRQPNYYYLARANSTPMRQKSLDFLSFVSFIEFSQYDHIPNRKDRILSRCLASMAPLNLVIQNIN